jgi:outer membrane immunogenic protein
MKKLLLSSFAALALTAGSSAYGADLARPAPAYKAPPAAAPAVSWTGCYIDGGVGYGMADVRHHVDATGFGPITTDVDSGGEGWLGRVGAGCDYQISRFVVGVFGDYDFSNINGTWADPLFVSGAGNNSSAWAVGGRIGYLVTPSLLTYVDGGYTQMTSDQVSLNLAIVGIPPATGLVIPSNTFSGWFIGGGTEYALTGILPINGLFWRTEYRYSQYQSAELAINCSSAILCGAVGPTGLTEHVQQHQQTITSGLVWRFNFSGY